MRTLITTVAAAGAVSALAGGLLAGPALADPPNNLIPPHNAIVGTGSDATQYLTDQLAKEYNGKTPRPARKLYSWDALGSPNITEKVGCVSRARPAGSGTGITELEANLRPKNDTSDYCVDYARSTSGRQSTDPSSIVYIPYAIDGVTWAADTLTGSTHAKASLSTQQLKAIYSCDASILNPKYGDNPVTWKQLGGTSTDKVIPVVPISSSGTRKFFLAEIGVSTLGTCVQGQDNSVTESEGTNAIFQDRSTAPDIIVPYSVGVYLAQSQNGVNAGDQGSMVLRSVNGVSPTSGAAGHKQVNTSFPYDREIYNVVRNASDGSGLAVPTYLQPIFGDGTVGSGWLCTAAGAKAAIKKYGFLLSPRCGALE